VLQVGPHAIATFSGILSTDEHYADVAAAADAGTTVDPFSLNYGFYYSAPGFGLGVAYGAINHAVKSNRTTVSGGATVAATGGISTVITNKSTTAHAVTIRVDGKAAGQFALELISGTDPGTMNTRGKQTAIKAQTGRSGSPLMVPAYSGCAWM
jgi:hypothetical protein